MNVFKLCTRISPNAQTIYYKVVWFDTAANQNIDYRFIAMVRKAVTEQESEVSMMKFGFMGIIALAIV